MGKLNRQPTYNEEFLQITTLTDLSQSREATVDLISQRARNVHNRVLWNLHLRNVWGRPEHHKYDRVPISKADRHKLAPQSTAKFDQFHLEGMRSLPVDESAGIGPEEEGGQGEDEAVAQQGEQMVLHDLEQEPDGRSASEHPSGDLLVPP